MNIFILANEQQKKEILSISHDQTSVLTFSSKFSDSFDPKNYDAFFILSGDGFNFETEGKPVFVNNVIETLSDMNLPENVSRISGWPGFLDRPLWEVVSNNAKNVESVFTALNRKTIFVKDEPGFVSARVISMIVNEAFFALGEKISSIEEIDMAMKLGTNYPEGPFEWVEKIGIENIYGLLEKLAQKEERYTPAPVLKGLYSEISERINQ